MSTITETKKRVLQEHNVYFEKESHLKDTTMGLHVGEKLSCQSHTPREQKKSREEERRLLLCVVVLSQKLKERPVKLAC